MRHTISIFLSFVYVRAYGTYPQKCARYSRNLSRLTHPNARCTFFEHFEQFSKTLAALAYASTSLGIIFTNKLTLTAYGFPSFKALALCQCIVSVIVLGFLAMRGTISFKKDQVEKPRLFEMQDLKAIFPLPILFFLNLVCGLGGTKAINIAMFTALRRFSILFMMILEIYLPMGLNYSNPVRISVGVILLGGVIAAANDLAFDFWGYGLVMGNNVFTALQGVVTKMKLSDVGKLNKFGLLYYNSLCSIPIFALLIVGTEPDLAEDLRNYAHWGDPGFQFCLLGSIVLGVILNYCIFWCTQVNSATTTGVIGSMKNIISAYAAILGLGGDYVFSWMNFIGLNISMGGAVVYSYFKLFGGKA